MKSEYQYLLEFFIQVAAFEAVTSTFSNITTEEKEELNSTIRVFKSELAEVLPNVQNREANYEAGRIAKFDRRTKESSGSL